MEPRNIVVASLLLLSSLVVVDGASKLLIPDISTLDTNAILQATLTLPQLQVQLLLFHISHKVHLR